MSPMGRPEGEYRSAQHEGDPVCPMGRPEGEYRSAQHEGDPVCPMGRPEDEYRSAQHEACPVSATDCPRIPTAGRARAGGSHAASGVAWRR